MEKGTKDLDSIICAIVPILMQYDIDRAFIFGSYARGEADDSSDIDLGVDAPRVRTFILGEIIYKLEKELSLPVDVIPVDMMSPEFIRDIEKDAVTIYER